MADRKRTSLDAVTRRSPIATSLFGMLAAALVAAALFASHAACADDAQAGGDATAEPAHLKISGSQRTRYERLDPQFRKGFDDSDQVVALQTSVVFDWSLDAFQFVGEIMDSRGELNDEGSFVTNTVDTLEPIQAYFAWHKKGMFEDSGDSTLRVGRMTLDLGKRRMIARNRYRNTVNNFLGADWSWRDGDGRNLRLFYFQPMLDRARGHRLATRQRRRARPHGARHARDRRVLPTPAVRGQERRRDLSARLRRQSAE